MVISSRRTHSRADFGLGLGLSLVWRPVSIGSSARSPLQPSEVGPRFSEGSVSCVPTTVRRHGPRLVGSAHSS